MPDSHALLAPSGAHRWMPCPGSLALEATQPESTSAAADEGTRAHELAEAILKAGDGWTPPGDVDLDMLDYVLQYTDAVRAMAEGNELFVEERIDFSHVVGVENSFGTSDAVVIAGTELQIHDLKYGRGVRVFAEHNEQLQIYALGALEQFSLLADFETVRLVIHQPRLNHVSEWVLSVDELQAFGSEVQIAAAAAIVDYNIAQCDGVDSLPPSEFTPGEKQCRFCRGAAVCAARAQHHLNTIADDFVDLDQPLLPQLDNPPARLSNEQLAEVYGLLETIESWCKTVRTRVNNELAAGHSVPGYKLVEGNGGKRSWSDAAAAEAMLKSFRLKQDQMYSLSVVSPTQAEKVLKKESPRRWKKIQALITRPEGKPIVVPETDNRPALNPINDFDDVTADDLI